jgi:MYXO-CTERM domain-containing protein
MLPLLLLAACTTEPEHPGLQPQLYADQEGQEILLYVEIFEGGDPGLEARYDMVNISETGEQRWVLRRHRFDPDLADEAGVACIGGEAVGSDTAAPDHGSCEGENPSCTGDCLAWYGFIVSDACQLAGQTSYELRLAGEEDAITVERFYVVDMGAECEGGGCSSGGAQPGAWWMGLASLAALGWRRRDPEGAHWLRKGAAKRAPDAQAGAILRRCSDPQHSCSRSCP